MRGNEVILKDGHESMSGRVELGVKKRFITGGWLGTGISPRGIAQGPKLLQLKECMDRTLRHWVCFGAVLCETRG